MQKLLTGLIDVFLPPSKEELLLRAFDLKQVNQLFDIGNYRGIHYLGNYSEPLLKIAITGNKFHGQKSATKLLGCLLKEWSKKQTVPTLYIPIPLGTKRERNRGYNQVEVILRAAKIVNVDNQIIQRIMETAPQSRLAKKQRKQNIKNAFIYTKPKFDLSLFEQVVLIDDVVTTGSTMRVARATLAPHLPSHLKLTCLAIVH